MILTIIGPHWLKRQNATYTFSFYIIKNNFLRLLRVEWSLRSSFLSCFRINPMHYFFFQFLFNHIKSIVNGIFHQIHSLLCNLLFYYSVSNNFLTMKDVKLITGSFYFTSWVGAKIQLVHRYQSSVFAPELESLDWNFEIDEDWKRLFSSLIEIYLIVIVRIIA